MKTTYKRRISIVAVTCLLIAGAAWLAGILIRRQIEKKIETAIPGKRIHFSSMKLQWLHPSITLSDVSVDFGDTLVMLHLKTASVKGVNPWKWLIKKELVFDSADIAGGNVSFRDKLYRYKAANVCFRGNMSTGDLSADAVGADPLYGKVAFGRILHHQADYMQVAVTGIRLTGISMTALVRHALMANRLSVEHFSVSVFRDRRLHREPDMQPLPATMIRKIPIAVRLNSIRLKNGTITYEEQPKNGSHTGVLRIERARLSLEPFISRPLKSDSHTLLTSEASLMGSGRIFTSVYVPLHGENYHVRGAFESLDLTRLNSASENLGGIHIDSGFLDSLGFDFRFNETQSTGKIIGIYHHLIVQPLKKKNNNKKIDRFKSFMLRHLVIPLNKDRSLPERKRTGDIRYHRDPTRKVSFYLLQSLLTGIKSSFKLGFLLPK